MGSRKCGTTDRLSTLVYETEGLGRALARGLHAT